MPLILVLDLCEFKASLLYIELQSSYKERNQKQ